METPNIQAIAGDIILALNALSSVVKLYDSNNTAVIRQIDALYESVQSGFSKGVNSIRLTLRSDEFFGNTRNTIRIRADNVLKSFNEF